MAERVLQRDGSAAAVEMFRERVQPAASFGSALIVAISVGLAIVRSGSVFRQGQA